MSALRPLPPKPNIEFERKEAKKFLRELHAGDVSALSRAREQHNTIDVDAPERIQLADAQLVIAREYGFTSWPRLVRYFGEADRQSKRIESGNREARSTDYVAESVVALLKGHQNKRQMSLRTLGAYVPRFYGSSLIEISALTVTEDEARLAIARREGFANWSALMESANANGSTRLEESLAVPLRLAGNAIDNFDLGALKEVAETHPELLRPLPYESARGATLIRFALARERAHGAEAMRPIIEWLESCGYSAQHELNLQLCGHMYMRSEDVRYLLDRGADPNWIAPNGFSVFEHALIRYWSAEAVDVLAAHATHPKALWVSAALGDVSGVREFLDRDGKPTAQARENRPDFNALTHMAIPALPEASDEEILAEAFIVAVSNSRVNVLEYMMSRGFPVNTLMWEMPILAMAAGNRWEAVVASLVRGGADVNLQGVYNGSARELAREMLIHQPLDDSRRRIAELCGVDLEGI